VEGNPLDEPGEHFLGRWLRTGSHAEPAFRRKGLAYSSNSRRRLKSTPQTA
jgi:hypothetical protein